MIRSQLSRVILWNGALSAIPALTIRRSIGPFAARASSNAAAMRLGIGDVASDRHAAMLLGDRLERLQPAAEQRQLRARRAELLGGCGANAGSTTGDQRMAPGKRTVAIAPFASSLAATASRWQGGGA